MNARGDIAMVLLILGPDLTAAEWAERLDVPVTDVLRVARDVGVEPRPVMPAPVPQKRGPGKPRALTEVQERAAVAAYLGGLSLVEVGKVFGVDPKTVSAAVQRAGVKEAA